MTIVERALELVPSGSRIGLGSGRAAEAFVEALGEWVRTQHLRVQAVATSEKTARLTMQQDIPLLTLAEAGILDVTVDGADEVDTNLDLIKGYGRALVREKIVAASSRRLIILVGEEKLVAKLGTRGKLPVEVVPFAVPLCERRLGELGCRAVPYVAPSNDASASKGRGSPSDKLFVTDNGNHIIDCEIEPIEDAARLENDIRMIPGVVGTGLFLDMADTVLIGDRTDFRLIEQRQRASGQVSQGGST
jgi:ribose 5-phosphate isomerase A